MRAGHQVLLPRAILGDDTQLDAYIVRIAEDMPRLADGFHPMIHETAPGTTEVRWMAIELPEIGDDGKARTMGRGEPWERGTPLPDWAQAVTLLVTVEIRARGAQS